MVDIYVDGSFMNEKATWGFIVVENGTVSFQNSGVLEGEVNTMRQIGGELKAVCEAVRYAKSQSIKARIFYDYTGIYFWVADYFGGKSWKAKNKFTQFYRKFIGQNREWIHDFVKVKAHDGNTFNEMVDQLAKQA